MRDLVGETFANRYRVIARIAGGGMGEVYRGHDLLLDRAVAVKVLNPGLASDPELVARFKAEARAAARLTHPNVVAVYDWGEQDDRTYYMVMEYVPGTDLRDVLVGKGAVEPAQAASIVADVCEALSAAHESGLVHRDVKPENVLIAPGGKVKVADFGIAAVVDTDLTAPGGVIPGTLRYLAPEQARGGNAGPASDIWAAGALLYELVTGTPPHQGTGSELLRRRAEEPLPAPSEFVATVPAELDAIVAKACALEPQERWATASDMGQALRRAGARSLADAPSLDSLLGDMTGEIRLMDMEPTSLVDRRRARPWSRRRSVVMRRLALLAILALLVAGATKGVAAFLAPRTVKVPSLTGLTKQRAFNRAESLGLKVDVTDRARSTRVERGSVISQKPRAGVLKQGQKIDIVISAGPPLRTVPTVEGATLEAATVLLRANGMQPGTVERAFSEQPAGIVVGQSPKTGKLAVGSKVSLVVSKGPEVVSVPSVAGMTPGEAKDQLRAAGFVVDTSTDFSDTVEKGLVVGTTPTGGSEAAEGSSVVIIVSAGPRYKELTMPDVRTMSVDAATAQLEGLGLIVNVVQSCGGGTVVQETDPIAGTTVRQHDRVALFVC
jgi:eukaryotic-like serine/threonine-protein kinase